MFYNISSFTRALKEGLQENFVQSPKEMKASMLIAKELKIFKNFAQFQQATELIVEICRQSEGWLKKIQQE